MFLYSLLDSVTWYPILFDTTLNAVRSVAIWVTLTAVIAYLVCLFVFKTDKRKRFLSVSFPIVTAYACALGMLFLILSFHEDGIETILFVPLLVLLISVASVLTVLCFTRKKTIVIGGAVLIAAAFVTTLVCMGIHFSSGKAAENNWLKNEDVQSVALYIASALSVAFLIALVWLFGRKERNGFVSKSVTYAAICIAMSFALSFMRIIRLPQGGSITPASLLPLMLYACMFGVKKGVFAGFTYGLLQAFQDPSVLHPAQFLLDYPIAFAWIGIAGIFSHLKPLEKYPQLQFALGGILSGLGRFAMHFLSGAFAFGVFAPEGTPVLLYSFLYQAGYVLPDLAIAVAVGIALFSSKAFVKEIRKFPILLSEKKARV